MITSEDKAVSIPFREILRTQIRRPDFAVACQRAVGMRFRIPESEITNVAARFAILEGHQQRHSVLEDNGH